MSIRRFWRLQRNDRLMYYRLLSAQVDAGFVAARACRELAELDGLPAGIREIARAGGQSEYEGRPAVDGMAMTGLLPAEDMAILAVAYEYGSLPEALRRLADRKEEIPGVFSRVVAPNLYYLLILGVLAFMIMTVSGFFDRMRLPGEGNPLYEASITFQAWGPVVLGSAGTAMATAIWIVKRWTSLGARKILEPFDSIERLRTGIRFCDLAAMMARHGAVGHVILEHAAEVFRGSPYLRRHARIAHDLHVTRGTRLEDALAEGVLDTRYASLLKGLVPGRALDRYEAGYRTLSDVQRQMLEHRLGALGRIFRILLLAGILVGFMVILDGIYSMYDSFNAYQ